MPRISLSNRDIFDSIFEIFMNVIGVVIVLLISLALMFSTYALSSLLVEYITVSIPACEKTERDSAKYLSVIASKYTPDNIAFLYEYNLNFTKCETPRVFNKSYGQEASKNTINDIKRMFDMYKE